MSALLYTPRVPAWTFLRAYNLGRLGEHTFVQHPNVLRKSTFAKMAVFAEDENAANVEYQAEVFNKPSQINVLGKPQPETVAKRLREITMSVPGLSENSRVLDVGSGTGVLIPFFQERGVQDILAVDVAVNMIQAIKERFPASRLGNEKGVRTWQGNVESVPAYQGPFDAAFFNSVFGNILDQRQALLFTALQLKPGGHLVLSHPLGSAWLEGLRKRDTKMVPNSLPSRDTLEELIADLPLEITSFRDEDNLYCAVLQVPDGYTFKQGQICVEEEVVTGFGRGSRQMGIPTANLKPEALFAGPLDGLPLGVYFGWAQLQGSSGEEGRVHKTVLNIGRRPAIQDGDQRTVELHILHSFPGDFYGRRLKAALLGYIRPEMNFGSLEALVDRIKADIGLARKQLDLPQHANVASSNHFAV